MSADVCIAGKKYQDALPALLELEKTTTGETQEYTWYRLGRVYLKSSLYERAIFYFEKLLSPSNGTYYTRGGYLVGVCLEYLNRVKDAIQFYQQIANSEKSDEWVEKSRERAALLTTK
ncbi:MAG: hypothetical protein NTX88_05045 [Candidatus Atribacteria bacterium]|nr:hypothetical protein [Candidatus Atribacteria bacterium]